MFQKSVLEKYVKNINVDQEFLAQKFTEFESYYKDPARIENIKQMSEIEFQDGFLEFVFVKILGYTKKPNPNYNLEREKRNESLDKKDTKRADAAIIIDGKVKAVIELKGCNTTNLDKVLSQALDYKFSHPGCRYVIISNFEKLRFYIDDKNTVKDFNLFELRQEEFNQLYTLLAYKQLRADIPAKIKEKSLSKEIEITKEFYKKYIAFKNDLFENICELNPQYDKLELFTKTHKLLDRLLFIFFSEDKGILDINSTSDIIQRYQKAKEIRMDKPLYFFIKQFFGWIDTGDEREGIFAYNGGLFKKDEMLDSLKISDEILEFHCKKLAEYDFKSEVSVDILGHIFEHSIIDIENKRNEIEGIAEISRRKKDGVFYTPTYITQYIVENTLGALCSAKKAELGINDDDFSEVLEQKRKSKMLEIAREKIAILEIYRQYLLGLKICDPACGSGAFLNATLKFLKAEHKLIDELKGKLSNDELEFRYYDDKILENNIYGVDISKEGVEIAKLSLWLNTAKKDTKLTTLSDKIKCGNSLITEKFDWQKEFPEVFENGGFDVIVGNPPYIKEYTNKSAFDGFRDSPYYKGKMDLWYAFVCRGIDLLHDNGILGFIAQNNWTTSEGASIMRNKVIEDAKILQMIDFNTFMVFEDAEIQTMIMTFQKNKSDDNYLVDYRKIIGNKSDINDVFALLRKQENLNIKYLSPKISRQKQKDKNLTFNEHNELLSKIAQNKFFFNKSEVAQGIVPALDDYFIVNRLDKFSLEEKAFIKPFFTGIKNKYETCSIEKYLIYMSAKNFSKNNLDDLPNLKEHFEPHKDELKESKIKYGTPDKPYFFLHRERDEKFFKDGNEKIVVQNRSEYPKFLYTTAAFYGSRALFFIQTTRFNMKFLVAILNSKLICFWCKNISKQQGKMIKLDKASLMEIPLPNINQKKQKELADFADEMIKLNAELSRLCNKFFEILKASYQMCKIPSALNEFYELDFQDFIEKSKLKISIKEKDELFDFFKDYKENCQELKAQITATESKINTAVYALYDLTADEIKTIENS